MKRGIVSFIVVAVGDEVGLDAVSVDISDVADKALADDTVVGLVSSTRLARSKDPEISFIAVALSVLEISIDSAVLIVTALSINDGKTSIAGAASTVDIKITVDWARVAIDALSVDQLGSVVAMALSIAVGLVTWANRLAESSNLLEARLAKASI